MKRADLLRQAAAVTALSAAFPVETLAADRTAIVPLKPPVDGVLVAFLLSDGAVMIDFAGPWEVFQDANVAGRTQAAFTPYTVAESTAPLTVSGGARILPQYEFARAPAPKVVVVPAQSDPSPATKQWLQKTARSADLMMSVCTGAFVLAKAGLLDGHSVTTHHNSLQLLAMEYPKLTVRRGARFVDDGHIATSAGLSAGDPVWLVLRLYREFLSRADASQTSIEALVYELCAHVAKHPTDDSSEPAWLSHIDRTLRERFAEPIDIAGLAAGVGVHPVHLCRTFRRFRSHTISDALLGARVQHVARRLTESDEALSNIACEAGFSDQSHMTRVFKRFTGYPPGEHRRRERV
jgi:transcriptional regulator GlxA family with amidase domain